MFVNSLPYNDFYALITKSPAEITIKFADWISWHAEEILNTGKPQPDHRPR
jgi:hypothetical protein